MNKILKCYRCGKECSTLWSIKNPKYGKGDQLMSIAVCEECFQDVQKENEEKS